MIIAIVLTITVVAVCGLFAKLVTKLIANNPSKWTPQVDYRVGCVGDVITHVPYDNKTW